MKGYIGLFWGFRVLGVVISEVLSKVSRVPIHLRGLITILITTHEPPSRTPPKRERGFSFYGSAHSEEGRDPEQVNHAI